MVILSFVTTGFFLVMVAWNTYFSSFYISFFMLCISGLIIIIFLFLLNLGCFFFSSSFRCKVSCILKIFLFYQYIFLKFSSYLLICLNLNIYLFIQLVAISNPKRFCCESAALIMSANLENSAVATGLEKVSFHSNTKERQCQRMFKLLHN